ncbi:hypothetical protein EVAR_52062_1 [Eumeta japonica]|uniref:Uncharacterized protein n=1 Tax=Eumeta variegata TaxID=151549 RepID=A0A4C1Z3C5_EUMVA|nr:hypothetical protein EVAR_52062_1 [Eumeta japonica]
MLSSDPDLFRGKRAGEPWKSGWSPPPMDTRNSRKVSSALPASLESVARTKRDKSRYTKRSVIIGGSAGSRQGVTEVYSQPVFVQPLARNWIRDR